MAPVTLNEATFMAVRRIDIHRVQHLRCKVQQSSKKMKQRRATFRIGCRYLKWIGTMVHHSPGMVNRRPATVFPFYRKNSCDGKTKAKKLQRPNCGSDSLLLGMKLSVD